MTTWKRDFASGLVVVTPLLVIVFVIGWVYTQLSRLGVPEIQDAPEWLVPWTGVVQVLISLVVFVLLVFSAGYLMRTTAGRVLEGFLDDAINRVPGLRVLYNASKLAVETALTGTEDLQTPVKIEPWPGMRMTAFKTGKVTADGRETVFLPTAPNITTGFVIEIESEEITETEEDVEEALTRILSAGFGDQDQAVPIDVEDAVEPTSPADRGEVDVDVGEQAGRSDGGTPSGDSVADGTSGSASESSGASSGSGSGDSGTAGGSGSGRSGAADGGAE